MINSARHGLTAAVSLVVILFGAMLMTGCGGGSGTAVNTPVDTARGSIEFRVKFPTATRGATAAKAANQVSKPRGRAPYDGSIPLGSHSVKITVTNATTGALLVPARIVSDNERPDGVTGTIAVGFPLVPVGSAKVDVAAFPALDGTGAALANGTTMVVVTTNTITTATVLLNLTLDTLVVTPKTQQLHTLNGSGSVIVDAQALDAQGNPLLYPLQYSSDTPTLADITNISPDFMHATISSSASLSTPTPVTITVTEPNSGTTATAQVIVGP